MNKPISRLRSLIVRKHLKSYAELYRYVHRYCGLTLIEAVERYRPQLEKFCEVKNFAEIECGFQSGTERTTKRKHGLSGCSMTYETKIND